MIRLFVGVDCNGCDAESAMVLEYSVKKYSSLPVDITWMKISNIPHSFWHGWDSSQWSTPFSAFRFGIPQYCDFEGKAIYCDSDFIFLKDIAQLWNQEFHPGKVMMAKGGIEGWRTCLMMWNNPLAKEYVFDIQDLKLNSGLYRRQIDVFVSRPDLIQQFDGDWNNVDGENQTDINQISALHYSSMNHQLHLKYAIPRLQAKGRMHWFDGKVEQHWRTDLQALFDQYYNEAITAGYKVEDYDTDSYIDYKKLSQSNYRNAHTWVR